MHTNFLVSVTETLKVTQASSRSYPVKYSFVLFSVMSVCCFCHSYLCFGLNLHFPYKGLEMSFCATWQSICTTDCTLMIGLANGFERKKRIYVLCSVPER